MSAHRVRRRSLLVAGAALATAGCLGADSDPDPARTDSDQSPAFPEYDLPMYADWPPAVPRTRDFVLFTHVNAEFLRASDEEDEAPIDGNDLPAGVTLPMYGLIVTGLWYYLALWSYPWQGTLGGADEPAGMDTAAVTMTEGTFVFHGEYDPAVFVADYASGFVERELDGYTVLEGDPDGATGGLAYAVSEEAVVVALDVADTDSHAAIRANLEAALATQLDEQGRVLDDEDGRWLLETTGPPDIAVGCWGVDGLEDGDLQMGEDEDDRPGFEDDPVFAEVESFVSTLALPETEGRDGGAARFAAIYPDDAIPSEASLQQSLLAGDDGFEESIVIQDNRVFVEAASRD